ncbi:MAG: hypothetical protein J1F32_06680 [Erysipelotrichales bacterium]|nr:hypothetical protein [Erysipelotrichales bacterium]
MARQKNRFVYFKSNVETAIRRKYIEEYQVIIKSSSKNYKKQYDVDQRILDVINGNEVFETFNGENVKIREQDSNGNTGAEHIAAAKHAFATEDIKFIKEALLYPNKFIFGAGKKRDEYYLEGTFGINKDKKYLHVSVGYDKNNKNNKVIITAHPTNKLPNEY